MNFASKKNVLIVATHPIQYHAPWFRELSKDNTYNVTVLFGMMPNAQQQSTGFGKQFSWDIPLTDGYQWQALENKSESPNLSTFAGVDCPGIYQVIKDHSPDAIIITGWHSKLLIQTLWAAKRLGVKTIMRGESNAKKPRPWFIKLLHTVFLARFDAFLAIGKSNKQFLLNNKVNHEHIFNAPYFVENPRFVSQSNAENLDNQVSKLNSNDFCFVYSGKLIEKKNVLELIKGFKICYESNEQCQMIIIGDGELREPLEAFVDEFQLPVTFLGFVNQSLLPATYALGNCFLLGSDYDETWGLVVNEAMACQLPAIVSHRAGCSDDLIIEGQTGYVYQYGDIDGLAQRMLSMVCNPELTLAMGKQAQKHVLDHYDVSHTLQATKEALAFLDVK